MDEPVELLVNLRNGTRAERSLPGGIRDVQQAREHARQAAAAAEALREGALERLRARALDDEVVRDLLHVLGLSR